MRVVLATDLWDADEHCHMDLVALLRRIDVGRHGLVVPPAAEEALGRWLEGLGQLRVELRRVVAAGRHSATELPADAATLHVAATPNSDDPRLVDVAEALAILDTPVQVLLEHADND